MQSSLILGIESSCDETSAAVVRAGTEVLSNVVASQLIHANYGGVVPELASREHLRAIVPVVREALHRANVTYADLDAIAVTEGPGLAGALLVGITFAKAAALGAGKPLIGINHLEGHIHAVLMQTPTPYLSSRPERSGVERPVGGPVTPSPLLALVVSGGHTHLYLATRTPQNTWTYRNVGKTLDDAAGEAFDKAAKLLGLPYPGGPWMDALALHGDPKAVPFAFAQIKEKRSGKTAPKLAPTFGQPREARGVEASFSSPLHGHMKAGALAPGLFDTRFDLSFSGIKTAVRRYAELHHMRDRIAARDAALRAQGIATAKPTGDALTAALAHFDTETLNLIASFQASVTGYLTRTVMQAAEHFGAQGILVSGGVAANRELRNRLTAAAQQAGLAIAFPTIALSTDNAAMIAAAAWPKFLAQDFAPDTLEPTPQLRLG